MQVLRLERVHSEAFVVPLQELGQEGVAGLHVAVTSQSQLLDQAVLRRAVGSLDAALGLTDADDADRSAVHLRCLHA